MQQAFEELVQQLRLTIPLGNHDLCKQPWYAIRRQGAFQKCRINFDPGKRYGLVGANGAGKSTLLEILTNDENPTEGKVSVPKELKLGFLRTGSFQL